MFNRKVKNAEQVLDRVSKGSRLILFCIDHSCTKSRAPVTRLDQTGMAVAIDDATAKKLSLMSRACVHRSHPFIVTYMQM
jgi:hypothetical protein